MIKAYRGRNDKASSKRVKNILVILLVLLFTCSSIYIIYKFFWDKSPTGPAGELKKVHYNYEVTPLINKDYFYTVDKEFKRAKKSIRMLMLVAGKGKGSKDPVSVLLQDLINAHRRGLKVEIILDGTQKYYETNLATFNVLRANGVNVRLASGSFKIHDKFIIIDDVTVIVGAHNWTYSALMLNNETSVLIKSNPPDPSFVKYFERVKKQAGSRATNENIQEIQKRLTQ